MTKITTFSRTYPAYHPKVMQPTYFIEKIWKSFQTADGLPEIFHPFIDNCIDLLASGGFEEYKKFYDLLLPKYHTIRAGHRFRAGDYFSPRVWGDNVNPESGKKGAYQSNQITIAPDIEVKKTWHFELAEGYFKIGNRTYDGETGRDHELLEAIAKNDGLEVGDFKDWFLKSPGFRKDKCFYGQIICWSSEINY